MPVAIARPARSDDQRPLVAAVVVVFGYWYLYLLEPAGNPFDRGPFVTRLGERYVAEVQRAVRGELAEDPMLGRAQSLEQR